MQINSIIFFVQIKKFLIPDPNEFILFPLTTGVYFEDVFIALFCFQRFIKQYLNLVGSK